LGFALEDLVTAFAAYQKARQKGIGLDFKFDQVLDVIHAVDPGANFPAQDHSLKHFRNFWMPNNDGKSPTVKTG
jgi:hypothetical protein